MIADEKGIITVKTSEIKENCSTFPFNKGQRIFHRGQLQVLQ